MQLQGERNIVVNRITECYHAVVIRWLRDLNAATFRDHAPFLDTSILDLWRSMVRADFCIALILLLAVSLRLSAAEQTELSAEQRNHWAWKPVRPVIPPETRPTVSLASPIDAFVSARLDALAITPTRAALREQLIRRVSFDLIGLPPSPEEIDDFVNDAAQDAFERLIDRLLASPHYGERWGRHWLDLARYADSNGYEYDELRPDAWRYRDYVIDSFNADKPYDTFIREQLAGDEIDPDNPAALIATAFNLLGPDMTDSSDQLQRRHNTLNDMTDTVGLALLGLTIGCARCHDHKFEPFSQRDYYQLQAFFTPARFRHDLNIVPRERRAELSDALANYEARRNPVKSALDELERPFKSKLRAEKLARQSEEVRAAHETPEDQRTPAERERVAETIRFVSVSQAEVLKEMDDEQRSQHKELSNQLKSIESTKPVTPLTMGLQDSDKPEKTFMLEMGDPAYQGDEVQPAYLAVLSTDAPTIVPPALTTTGRRAVLANWIADERHPLTARVMANRIWSHHFGRGIVSTPSDFGVKGEPPTHPELLDWLASEFVRSGWSIKQMHRRMLESSTYRQSTFASTESRRVDPDNRWFSRMHRHRLEGEVVRDSLLAISGRLSTKQGGPGVSIAIVSADKGARKETGTTDPLELTRRSVYLTARRNQRNPFLEVFDLPDSNLSCARRDRSVTALQALALFNETDVVAASQALAKRLEQDADPVAAAYRRILGRAPTDEESKLARELLQDSPLSELCRALFNVNEFVYVD